MRYAVKELFLTLQGEGAHTGRRAVFCRFAGCNLWSGREADRARAQCGFCDTDFVGTDGPGGGTFADAAGLARAARALWDDDGDVPFIVMTGGEPLLQLDDTLIAALHDAGFAIAVETNGTVAAPSGIDWLTVSPKAGTQTVQRRGQELKLVYPQAGAPPEAFANWDFQHFFLQPMDGPARDANTQAALAYCRSHPQWRLSLQTHKRIGLP
ncbi:MAG: 7-carboxy-7-deazaguanine synthase [Alphaproteobacteria bacterium]|nr:MAG: 7-carboxy-7-deazaguanine synthase [Alphaproteobacteria bacterium]